MNNNIINLRNENEKLLKRKKILENKILELNIYKYEKKLDKLNTKKEEQNNIYMNKISKLKNIKKNINKLLIELIIITLNVVCILYFKNNPFLINILSLNILIFTYTSLKNIYLMYKNHININNLKELELLVLEIDEINKIYLKEEIKLNNTITKKKNIEKELNFQIFQINQKLLQNNNYINKYNNYDNKLDDKIKRKLLTKETK